MTRRDALQMALLSALWGVSFLLIRLGGEVFPPLWLAALRAALGAAVLLAALGLGRHPFPPLTLWQPLLFVAAVNTALPWTLFALGEQSVSSNIASVLNATTPLFTLLLSLGLGGTHLRGQVTGRMALGVLLGLGGVALTVSFGVQGGHAALAGVGALLLASACYAVATIVAKRRLSGVDMVGLAASQLLISAALLLPLALLGPRPAAPSLPAVAAVAVLGVAGSGLAYLLYYGLLPRLAPTQLSSITYALPLWGVFWGVLAGERVGPATVLGVGVVLSGLWLINAAPPAAGRTAGLNIARRRGPGNP